MADRDERQGTGHHFGTVGTADSGSMVAGLTRTGIPDSGMPSSGATGASVIGSGAFPANAVHLVRTNQQLTMQLSQMADQKASILMGATFVVFTLAIGQARIGNGLLSLPLAVLATFSFLSALLAISAVLPRIGSGPVGAGGGNILFFGQFAHMSEDDFIATVKQRLRSEEDLYETMLRDTYQNGVVLARRKYRYLAYAYRLFVVGLSLTFVIFAWDMGTHWLAVR